jgi:hypothetical protein
MPESRIYFLKEIAETLSIETAIVLQKTIEEKYKKISSKDDLTAALVHELSFMSQSVIQQSIEELIRFGLLEINFCQKDPKESNLIFAKANKSKMNMITDNWKPSDEALEVLRMGSVNINFVESKLAEFKIYWLERGQQRNNWNSTFIDYIRREWAKENNSNKNLPFPITRDWLPSEAVFEILALSEISKETAISYLAEFILYWTDNGAAFNTWNSKFIDHVKRRHLIKDKDQNEKSKNHSEPGSFQKEFRERKKDKSWAEELNFE